jgi:2-hydroxychromene-2-carboxylate isomerase
MRTLEFFYDYASPWSYMASCRVEALAADAGAELVWRPVQMSAVFQRGNPGVAAMRSTPVPAKVTHYYKDMKDWARRLGIVIGRPPVYGGGSKPLDSRLVLLGAYLALDRGEIVRYTRAMYEAYWHDLKPLAEMSVLADIVAGLGWDPDRFRAALDDPALAARLDATIDELVARGGFGVPTFFVDGTDMYYGNDRMDFVAEALAAG